MVMARQSQPAEEEHEQLKAAGPPAEERQPTGAWLQRTEGVQDQQAVADEQERAAQDDYAPAPAELDDQFHEPDGAGVAQAIAEADRQEKNGKVGDGDDE